MAADFGDSTTTVVNDSTSDHVSNHVAIAVVAAAVVATAVAETATAETVAVAAVVGIRAVVVAAGEEASAARTSQSSNTLVLSRTRGEGQRSTYREGH
jgi:hypothetical protein